jgi:hypothetical protein
VLNLSKTDLGMIAYDISDAIAKGEWPGIDVSSSDILPYLPDFLTKVVAHSVAAETQEGSAKHG